MRHGFTRPAKDFGLHVLDSFKVFEDRIHVALNHWPAGQNALAVWPPPFGTSEVLGHSNEPGALKLRQLNASLYGLRITDYSCLRWQRKV